MTETAVNTPTDASIEDIMASSAEALASIQAAPNATPDPDAVAPVSDTSPVEAPPTGETTTVSAEVVDGAAPAANVEARPDMSNDFLQMLLDTISPVEGAGDFWNFLLYGDFGTAKTTVAATFPKPLCIIDIDKGTSSIKNHEALVPGTDKMKFQKVGQIEYLLDVLEGKFGPPPPELTKYKTWVIDTVSELEKKDLDEIVATEYARNPSHSPFVPEGKDYQTNTERLRRILSRFRDLDCHFVMITHEKFEKEESTGVIYVRPNVTPQLSQTIGRMTHVIGYMTRREEDGKFIMQIQPSRKVTAKTRIKGLPAAIENPHFDMFAEPAKYFKPVTTS